MPASLQCNVCGENFARTAEHWHKQPKRSDGLSETCKSCAIARSRANYAANRADRYARNQAYRKTHPEVRQRSRESNREKLSAKQRDYYQRNVEAILIRDRKRKEANASKISERKKRKYWSNLEVERARSRAWAAAHPEIVQANTNQYRARRKAAPGKITAADLLAQYKKQRGACFYCHIGFDGVYTVDHYVPLIRGGTNDPSNIVLACKTCNCSKKDKLPQHFTARA